MIKELNNLRVRAIAITVPDDAHGWYRHDLDSSIDEQDLWFYFGTHFENLWTEKVNIPDGEWQILGRADELWVTKSVPFKLCQSKNGWNMKEEIVIEWRDYETDDQYPLISQLQSWQSYCTSNGLTNELILIHPTNSR